MVGTSDHGLLIFTPRSTIFTTTNIAKSGKQT